MAITIIKQPTSRVRFVGDVVYYTIEATGNGLTYQWEFKNATAGAQWGASGMTGNKTPSMSVEVTKARNGYQYRCKITDANGETLTSDVATLIVLDESAEIGFMSSQTVTEIADAIREKADITDIMIPQEMPKKILAIDSEIYTGLITSNVESGSSTISLGTALPSYDNYCFMIDNLDDGNRYGGIKQVLNGVSTDRCYVAGYSYTNTWQINFSNGTVAHQYFEATSSNHYRWVYFKLREVSA